MLLSRRDFCVRELHEHLQAQGYEAPVVQQVVAELRERGFVDDERYAQQYVALHAERGHGPLRIGRELDALGINPALVEATLAAAEDWSRRAREQRIRRFGLELPTDWPGKARQARFLQYRGFSNDHIRAALGAEVGDDLT
ncbi:MAG: regulatory protein RecX [Steroidobacteraceae bacterium]